MTPVGSFDEIMPTSFNTVEAIIAAALSETPVRSQDRANEDNHWKRLAMQQRRKIVLELKKNELVDFWKERFERLPEDIGGHWPRPAPLQRRSALVSS
ncbi:hypothetical protein EVAR_42449_1 [Eumeta japonica]|uniref:Uncharacterized protein n=1 Tax=Eumeta variegata TaxID=151549 RepID=A0A4C1XY21_EUMVA|nr:hypothetical protein EVAR_42449_1 [Eumeta japonica]